ncbi:MAG: hypothetical protein ABW065_09385 [Solirubrobacterales bacterium]
MTRVGLTGLGLFISLFSCLLIPSASFAAFEFAPNGAQLEVLDANGQPDIQAGSHPDRIVTRLKFQTGPERGEGARQIVLELPPGLSGDPQAVQLCPRALLNDLTSEGCPPRSQVGEFFQGEGSSPDKLYLAEPVGDQAIALGAWVAGLLPFTEVGRLRPQDQGLTLESNDLFESFGAVTETGLELFGVPADHQEGTSIPRRPLLTLPTRCGQPLTMKVRVRTWGEPNRWITTEADTGQPLRGCGDLPFDPSLTVSLDNPVADSPTGARIEMKLPQTSDADHLATAAMRDATVALPEGITVSPSGAQGLVACDDDQFGRGQTGPPACPGASRVGTATIAAPQLAKPLSGGVYLGEGLPGDRLRLFIYAAGGGAESKGVGSLRTDSRTGRLTAVLTDLPQVPFESLTLDLEGGSNSLLATPLECGDVATSATFSPYSGTAPVIRTGSLGIAAPGGARCGGSIPFAPTIISAATDPRAGRPTSFLTMVSRADGEQLPNRIAFMFPKGMSAALGAIEPCPSERAATGSCADGSRIGSALVDLGPGARATRLEGAAYLTTSYRRAPFGIALALPAKVGPFDFGTMVLRGAVRVDRLTGQVKVETDPLPRLLEGATVRFQRIGLAIDRPGFLHNPTSCAVQSVSATVTSTSGASSQLSSPFQASGCISLPFRPRFSVDLRGGMKRKQHPGLRISAKIPRGNANIRAASFVLPRAVTFDAGGLGALCGPGAAQVGDCPAAAQVGTAQARSSMFDKELSGRIFATRPKQGHSPDLWINLRGGGVSAALRLETREDHGRVEAGLREVPDLPLESLGMNLRGGERGVISLREGICVGGKQPHVEMEIKGQNLALVRQQLALGTSRRCH